jgi:hypothetical protein
VFYKLAQSGDHKTVEHLYKIMRLTDVKPNLDSFATCLLATKFENSKLVFGKRLRILNDIHKMVRIFDNRLGDKRKTN